MVKSTRVIIIIRKILNIFFIAFIMANTVSCGSPAGSHVEAYFNKNGSGSRVQIKGDEDVQMKNYAQKILDDQNNQDPIIEIMEIVQAKSDHGNEIGKLTGAEKVIYLICEVEGEVNNGGFSQYLFNSSGKYAKEATKALKEIGAEYTSSLLDEAIRVYKNGPTNDERNAPEEDLTEEQEDRLNELDDEFYEYKENLMDLQIKYIKKNISEF